MAGICTTGGAVTSAGAGAESGRIGRRPKARSGRERLGGGSGDGGDEVMIAYPLRKYGPKIILAVVMLPVAAAYKAADTFQAGWHVSSKLMLPLGKDRTYRSDPGQGCRTLESPRSMPIIHIGASEGTHRISQAKTASKHGP